MVEALIWTVVGGQVLTVAFFARVWWVRRHDPVSEGTGVIKEGIGGA